MASVTHLEAISDCNNFGNDNNDSLNQNNETINDESDQRYDISHKNEENDDRNNEDNFINDEYSIINAKDNLTNDNSEQNDGKEQNVVTNENEKEAFDINIHKPVEVADKNLDSIINNLEIKIDKLNSEVNKPELIIIASESNEMNIGNDSEMSNDVINIDNANDDVRKQNDEMIRENDEDNEIPSNDEMDTQNSDEIQNNIDLIDNEDLNIEEKLEKRYLKAYEKNRRFFNKKKVLDKPITSLECPVCLSDNIHTPQQLYEHLNTHITEKDKKYNCSICYALFNTNSELVHHKSTHKEAEIYFCIQCKLAFSEHLDWQLHRITHENYRLYKCKECYKFFVLKSVYQGHLRIHYDETIQCQLCEMKFKSEQYLKGHMELHSKTFECCECGKVCADESTLKSHLYTHIGYRPYQCHYCGLAFYTRTSRETHHKNVHIVTERPFQCKSCEKTFRNAPDLQKHINYRHIDHKIECDVCSKKIQKKYLDQHKLTHKVANYNCQLCPRRFTQRNSLKMHLIYKHTDTKPFQCDFCPKAFKASSCLKKHRKTHEKIKHIDRGVFDMK